MKDPIVIPIDEAVAGLDRFDTIVDARSPSEFADDHLPGAINAPVLDDAERALVGTIYKQQSSFEARRAGAAIVARNVGALIERLFADRPRDWRPLVYCWRGGNRSGALATVLARVGWRTAVLDGGYREFRRRVLADLERWPPVLQLRVLAGRTGTGKSLILQQLAAAGAQVLDLEAIACHRGSVLGLLPESPQPTQKGFETGLWDALRRFDSGRPVFVESESRRVGRCHVPDALIAAMRAARCTRVEATVAVRAALLLREYRHFTSDRALLFERLDRLAPLHGNRQVDAWKEMAVAGQWESFVESMLALHYDPAYDRSMKRNYLRIDEANAVTLHAADEPAVRDAARRALAALTGSPWPGVRDT
ncbi:MAG: tRNA 2-selenouridine(34) synthase MnmH [Burkholderiales bacterium]|nr:MAG: tRNA 2-selenouridine(34) synthase MnmH [Burkholderiales bacterium]